MLAGKQPLEEAQGDVDDVGNDEADEHGREAAEERTDEPLDPLPVAREKEQHDDRQRDAHARLPADGGLPLVLHGRRPLCVVGH